MFCVAVDGNSQHLISNCIAIAAFVSGISAKPSASLLLQFIKFLRLDGEAVVAGKSLQFIDHGRGTINYQVTMQYDPET